MPFAARGGVRLYYSDAEAGPAVFFHTGGGGDGTMWQTAGYLDALPGRRCLLFDHRGHGRSDQPTSLREHRLDEYVADVISILDSLGIEQASMVGYSDGARVAYSLAARHPDRVAAVVGIGGVSHPHETSSFRREAAEEVRKMGFRAWLQEMSARETEPAPDWLIENLLATPTEMFLLELDGWADDPTECAAFPFIKAPTLIVCGELENTDGAAELAAPALPHGQAVIIPGFGHLQVFWRSDMTAPYIAEFLNRHVPVSALPSMRP